MSLFSFECPEKSSTAVYFFLLENYSNQEMKIFFLKVTFLFPAELYQLRQNNSRILHLKRSRDYFFKITLILWDANELRACQCPTIRKYYFCDLQFILCWVRYSFHQFFFFYLLQVNLKLHSGTCVQRMVYSNKLTAFILHLPCWQYK